MGTGCSRSLGSKHDKPALRKAQRAAKKAQGISDSGNIKRIKPATQQLLEWLAL
jgi:hypothetical protein